MSKSNIERAAPALLAALEKLATEVLALDFASEGMRELVGNTNYSVLMVRVNEARAAIALARLSEVDERGMPYNRDGGDE